MYIKFFKPFFDYSIAFISLIILAPVFIIISICVKLSSKGPVFFKQERLGKNGRIFHIIKFRSMRVGQMNYEDDILNYYNNPRTTNVGRFLRNTSIDELPQLLNVLKGEMSILGPRPPLTDYPKVYEDYTDFERKRFTVKPGMSGLAQIRGRHEDNWEVNIPIDVEYVNNISFKNDMSIFFLSFKAFFNC